VCGRYVSPEQAAIERFWHIGRHSNINPFSAMYNVSPTMQVPILRRAKVADDLELASARWSFVPHWWKQSKLPSMTINARSEEAAIKPMWRDAFKNGQAHILMPAVAYWEWRRQEEIDATTGEVKSYKQPYCVHLPDRRPFCFAGLMSWWQPPDEPEPTLTCALLTRAASPTMRDLHNRMPVVLPTELFSAWTDPYLRNAPDSTELLTQAVTEFSWYPVPRLVNNARSEGPELMKPLS
jgi:putative SOS response-associated peptidase YedK